MSKINTLKAFSLIVLMFFSFGILNAQEQAALRIDYDNAVCGDIFGLLTHNCFTATIEHQINPLSSVVGFIEIYNNPKTSKESNDDYGIGVSYLFYPKIFPDKRKIIEGFSLGPFLAIVARKGGTFFEVGPQFGYKFIFSNIPTIHNIVVEPLFKIYIFMGEQGEAHHSQVGLNCNIGWAW